MIRFIEYKCLNRVESPSPEPGLGLSDFSTFLTFMQKFCTSGLGRNRSSEQNTQEFHSVSLIPQPKADFQESTIPLYLDYTCMQCPMARFTMDFLMHYQVSRQDNRPAFELDLPKVDRY